MSVFLVVSEELYERIPILDFGEGPDEPYAICVLVVADTREQARWTAWQTDKSFNGDVRDMPLFRTRKLDNGMTGSRGVVTDWPQYAHLWEHPKAIQLLSERF